MDTLRWGSVGQGSKTKLIFRLKILSIISKKSWTQIYSRGVDFHHNDDDDDDAIPIGVANAKHCEDKNSRKSAVLLERNHDGVVMMIELMPKKNILLVQPCC